MNTTSQALTLRAEIKAARDKHFPARLDCDTVNATPIDVDWRDVFSHEGDDARASIVYPDWSELEVPEVLDWIAERDEDAAAGFRERLAGLNDEDAAELAALDKTALSGPVLREDPFPSRLTPEQYERMQELRRERDDAREDPEDLCDEINEKATELAQDDLHEWEPMMDYAYPLPTRADAATLAAQLHRARLPVVVVELDAEPVIALSGGGMDLSWEICEAHAALGFMPPAHFCDLPRMSGRGKSERDLAILGACLESLELQAEWARGKAGRLLELAAGAAEAK